MALWRSAVRSRLGPPDETPARSPLRRGFFVDPPDFGPPQAQTAGRSTPPHTSLWRSATQNPRNLGILCYNSSMSREMEPNEPLAEPPADAMERGGKGRRSVVFRVLDLIQLVAAAPQPLTLAEIGTQLKLPKPTVHRLCVRLEESKYLTREPGRYRYRVGPATERLAFNAIRRGSASVQWRAILEKLVDEIHETCNFTALAGNEVVYVERVESRWPLRIYLETGSRVPIHCTASGKLFLAMMEPERQRRMLDTLNLSGLT